MNDPKELIQLVQQYGARLSRADGGHIKVTNSDNLPPNVVDQLRRHKAAILNYLDQSFIEIALHRAVDGYHWMLERKQQHFKRNRWAISDIRIETQEWRSTIMGVIRLSHAEVTMIERALIAQGELVYYGDEQYIMSKQEAAQEDDAYLLGCGISFSDWLATGRQFFRH